MRVGDHPGQETAERLRRERDVAGEEFVENDAERPDIGTRIDVAR